MKYLLTIMIFIVHGASFAQIIHKTIDAQRTEVKPNIDGFLEPELWSKAPKASNWTQIEPRNGEAERKNQKSEVQFLYTDKAIYVGAFFHDDAPDSILTELSLRDEKNKNFDWFGIWISPYNNAQNEFIFAVSAAGVQVDAQSSLNQEDLNWNAVWKSAVKIHNKGWTIEIEIPYSALRFPNKNIQEWGVNIRRCIRRTREKYSWNPIDITKANYAAQAGLLNGIENIDAPLRLSLMPYISSYADYFESEKSQYTNGGMDLKYGINESFTLDMTLVPDFGQTVFDDQILNLSPFEIQFNENRAFFTEGTELFNKAELFYSRRIGAQPSINFELNENEIITESPSTAQLLNASKISGRTKKGLGIGLFNAITAKTYATIEDTISTESRKELTEPLTNYNVLVLDKILKNNSFITFTNTNVSRKNGGRNANVEKLQAQIGSKDNSYTIYGDIAFSHIKENESSTDGFASYLSIQKSSGNFQYDISQSIESDTYEINDLGFLLNNNQFNHKAELSYFIFRPIGKLRKAHFEISYNRQMLYKPNKFNSHFIDADIRLHSTNFFSSGLSLEHTIGKTYDYFESRTNDLNNVFIYGPSLDMFWWSSTDYRKKFAGDIGFGYDAISEFNYKAYHIRWAPRYRVNNNIFMTYVISHKTEKNNVGRAFDSQYNYLEDDQNNLLYSKRDVKTITNVYKISYVINNKMSFDVKFRHYWSTLKHRKFFELHDGNLSESYFSVNDENNTPQYNVNYNAWNIDLNCLWQFAPGSELNLQWKNALTTLDDDANISAKGNLNRLMEESKVNSLSLKIIYYIDYQSIKGMNAIKEFTR